MQLHATSANPSSASPLTRWYRRPLALPRDAAETQTGAAIYASFPRSGLLWIIQISSRIITTHEMTTYGIDWLDACPNAYTPMPPSTSDQTMATKTWEYRLSLI